jgi:thioredoxin 1
MAQKNAFSKIIDSDTPVLIDFHATWCGPCKALAPIIQNVKKKIGSQAKIFKIDIDKNQALAQKLQIRGVPTLMLYKSGDLKWRQSGVVPESEIIRQIEAQIE